MNHRNASLLNRFRLLASNYTAARQRNRTETRSKTRQESCDFFPESIISVSHSLSENRYIGKDIVYRDSPVLRQITSVPLPIAGKMK